MTEELECVGIVSRVEERPNNEIEGCITHLPDFRINLLSMMGK